VKRYPVAALLALCGAGGSPEFIGNVAPSAKSGRSVRWTKPHQGAGECARRRRQMGLPA
jgi:hypothetical protein